MLNFKPRYCQPGQVSTFLSKLDPYWEFSESRRTTSLQPSQVQREGCVCISGSIGKQRKQWNYPKLVWNKDRSIHYRQVSWKGSQQEPQRFRKWTSWRATSLPPQSHRRWIFFWLIFLFPPKALGSGLFYSSPKSRKDDGVNLFCFPPCLSALVPVKITQNMYDPSDFIFVQSDGYSIFHLIFTDS